MHKRVLNKTGITSADILEQAPHFGHYLRKERESQGLSLEEISRRTGIKTEHLTALEEGERRRLPADAFSRGFIRIYADTLHLDPKEALDKYEKDWGFTNGMRGARTFLGGEHMAESSSPLADRQVLVFLAIVILVASSFLSYKIFFPQYSLLHLLKSSLQPIISKTKTNISSPEKINLSPQSSGSDERGPVPKEVENVSSSPKQENYGETNTPTPISDQKDVAENQGNEIEPQTIYPIAENQGEYPDDMVQVDNERILTTEIERPISPPPLPLENGLDSEIPGEATTSKANSVPASPPQVDQEQQKQPEKLVLQAHFTERTWLRITVDEREAAEYTFKPNEAHTWTAETKINLFLGNAGGVQLSFNGVPLALEKGSGQTLKITFP